MSGVDPMRGLVDAFPKMLEDAVASPAPAGFAHVGGRIMLLGGMGGSGMAASLGAHLLQASGTPAVAWRNDRVPQWLNEDDRVVLVSYSGITWEAVSMFEDARSRSVPLRAIASGGPIGAMCERHDVPLFRVPPEMPPRASLPWLAVGVARATGCAADETILRSARFLRELQAAPPEGGDPAVIARRWKDRFLIFVPLGPAMEMLSYRWRNQILENAEQACVVSPAPEMAHNEVMGWPWLGEAKIPVTFVALVERGARHDPWDRFLLGLGEEASHRGHAFEVIEAHGDGPFETAMASIHLADRVSVELASLRGVAATPVVAIGRLRAAMKREEN